MRPYKKVRANSSQIFLTFDDGPCPQTTPLVLKALSQYNAKATFFVIGNSALEYKSIVKEILSEGHSLGNHSIDHAYKHFFRDKNHLKRWIEKSQSVLADEFGVEPVAFRSPAGVITPPLRQALSELQIPWVHWNHRFFDTNVPLSWTDKFRKFDSGDILLFHDRQKKILRKGFLKSLDRMLLTLTDKGFDFQPLTKEKILTLP